MIILDDELEIERRGLFNVQLSRINRLLCHSSNICSGIPSKNMNLVKLGTIQILLVYKILQNIILIDFIVLIFITEHMNDFIRYVILLHPFCSSNHFQVMVRKTTSILFN